MKAIMVMFDSLNRHMLECYGGNEAKTPNFNRLAAKSVTFDRCYVGSMPCMPARRELNTGRYNFLHRSWGPLEPFDDSMPEILNNNGIYSHLISDHYHYWEEGGANYHSKFSSWENIRGQEGDPWVADVATFDRDSLGIRNHREFDRINRKYMTAEEDFPMPKTFAAGLKFLERNSQADQWYLQLETFDPHEPYFLPEKYLKMFDIDLKGHNDWPLYTKADDVEQTAIYRKLNAALVTMCDDYLGKIIDFMDEHNMWDDTMLIVNTDHGFLLGEHDWWGKCRMPFYNEVARTPLFIWDPRSGVKGEKRGSLVQTIDLPATVLSCFELELPQDMQGVDLAPVVEDDTPVRMGGLFGLHGGHVNCTDGRYVYMRAPIKSDNSPLFNYTQMPAHMRSSFSIDELQTMQWYRGFEFTKATPVMQIAAAAFQGTGAHEFGTMLFDLDTDPQQQMPLDNPEKEAEMIELMIKLMHENDAPEEQFERLGLG
ncbi:MAG: sulfatase [Victivallaceae bacterium]|nr:sulfatase [Victivallaceae bacterium]